MDSFSLGQRALAEALGTALLVLVGPGSVVATLVLAGDSTPAITGSDLLGISFAGLREWEVDGETVRVTPFLTRGDRYDHQ